MTAYYQPSDLSEALDLMSKGGLTIAAGCTDLFPATQAKTLPGGVLDLISVAGLRGIARDADGWRIGAATTWTDILHADLPAAFDGLKLAAREVGSVQIQNAGTLVGNLCTASPAGDGAPCLLTLDAEVELASLNGVRRLPLQAFLVGPRKTALQPDELVTAIHIPDVTGKGHFLKLGARKYLVISIAMVAARIDVAEDVIEGAALAVGSCSPTAVRLSDLENVITGMRVGEASDAVVEGLITPSLAPIDDIRGDAAYRIAAATELLRRVLNEVAE